MCFEGASGSAAAGQLVDHKRKLTTGFVEIRQVGQVLGLLQQRGILQRRERVGREAGACGTVDHVFEVGFVGVSLVEGK